MDFIWGLIVLCVISVAGIYLILNSKMIAEICLKHSTDKKYSDAFFVFQRVMISIVGIGFLVAGLRGIIIAVKKFF